MFAAPGLVIEQKLLRVQQRPDDVLVGLAPAVHGIPFFVAALACSFFEVRFGSLEFLGSWIA